ncbi:MAG: N-acetylmuramoyl-L-alanine amidase [Bacteroidales bacterium]|nr:N-acetylmuramoyl-L-alanine amidase [Bacteroidales bacterium]
MKRLFVLFSLSLIFPLCVLAQNVESQNYKSAFDAAYEACPTIPKGLLEAISFTNTHCHHLTDANYFNDGPEAMPRAYGLMGLVKDGKGYFRENLQLVSELSGVSETEILVSPDANVMAYAKAFECLAKKCKMAETKDYLSVIQQFSELPIGEEKDVYPMQSMLYSVCSFMNDEKHAEQYGFTKYDIDLKAVFAEHYDMLTAPGLSVQRESDYPAAIWDPAPDCNYSERTLDVSAVVIHYTEGSYAGCISWFKNCDAQVSAHYVIRSSDGQVTQMVREADKAWHARTANGYTIGIEHEAYGNIWSFFTDAMYQSSANLVRDICSRYESIDGHRTFYRDTLDSGICLNEGLHDLGGENACVKIRGHQHYPDQSHTDPGPYWDWNYYYKLINEGTPVTVLEGEEGRLDHQYYGDDERKIWVIRGPEGKIISLDFKSFDLEKDFDFLWVYDGDDVYAPKIGRWNTQSPGTVHSSGNVMCVEFRSDCATNASGWQAEWKAIKTIPIEPEEPEIEPGVFPNPTTGKFTVKSDREGLTDLTVFDVYGNMITSLRFQNLVEIEASNWASGVYMIHYGEPNRPDKVVKLVKW